MMKSLSAKLTLSHIIPTLLLMPVLSLFLLYTLENFYTQSLVQQLVYQAQLLRNEIERDPDIALNPAAARDWTAAIALLTDARVVLLGQEGTIIASSRREDAGRIGTRYVHASVTLALSGEMAKGVGPGFAVEVAYVVLPVRRDNVIVGALRLSYEVNDVHEQFGRLRWLIAGGIAFTVMLALGVALGLAMTIIHPLRQLSSSVQQIATGSYHARVAVKSQDEVGALANSFNRMAEQLEEAARARERQLAAIAHELTRPLAGMQAAVETLRDAADAEPEMRDTLLGGLEEEMARLKRLVQTLHTLHERGGHPLRLERSVISLERVIRASTTNFEPRAAQASIVMSAQVPPALPLIQADQDRLIQVLTNLLDNAFKFTPRGGRITVRAGQDAQSVWVSVTDTGAGITPEELPHVFQQFYSGSEARPPEKRGMGLGLSICREIIIAHGGKIWAESQPGHGACFTFTLPASV